MTQVWRLNRVLHGRINDNACHWEQSFVNIAGLILSIFQESRTVSNTHKQGSLNTFHSLEGCIIFLIYTLPYIHVKGIVNLIMNHKKSLPFSVSKNNLKIIQENKNMIVLFCTSCFFCPYSAGPHFFCLHYHLEARDGNYCRHFTQNPTCAKSLRNRAVLPKIILTHVTGK